MKNKITLFVSLLLSFICLASSGMVFSRPISAAGITITTTSLPDGMVGSAYLANMAASGGTGTGYAWSATSLPDGLGINGDTGAITGSPTTLGPYTPDFTVIDSHGNSIDKKLNLTINPAGLDTDATLSDLKVNGTPVTGFTPATTT